MLEFSFSLEYSIMIYVSNFKLFLIIIFYINLKIFEGEIHHECNELNLRVKWITWPPLKRAAKCGDQALSQAYLEETHCPYYPWSSASVTSQPMEKYWGNWGIHRKCGCQPGEVSIHDEDAFPSPKPGDGIFKRLSQGDWWCLEKGKAGSLSKMETSLGKQAK